MSNTRTDTLASLAVAEAVPSPPPNASPPNETDASEAVQKKLKARQYRQAHLERIQANERRYRESHRESINRKQAERIQKNPELQRARVRASTKCHLERKRAYERMYYSTHKQKRDQQNVTSTKRHPERCRAWRLLNRVRNGDKLRAYFKNYLPAYRARKRVEDPQFLIKDRLRSALRRGLKNQNLKKTDRTEAMIGCTVTELRGHIESQFTGEMAWKKPESFVIDHWVPIAAFDLRDAEEASWAFNWRNLRPITQAENSHKSDSLPSPFPYWLPSHIADRILIRSRSA